jgi:hypothetical protein
MKKYSSQSARDAQAAGQEDYALYLEQHAFELRGRFLAAHDWATADLMLTRSLSESLMGNDGD